MRIKNVTQVYCLIVCLISTVVMMISLAIALNQGATMLLPEFKNAGKFVKYSSNEAYLRAVYDGYGEKIKDRYQQLKDLDPDELTKERETEHRDTVA